MFSWGQWIESELKAYCKDAEIWQRVEPNVSSFCFFSWGDFYSWSALVRLDLFVTTNKVRQLRVRENLLFPEASHGFGRSLLEQVYPFGVSSARQPGSRTVSVFVCVCLSLAPLSVLFGRISLMTVRSWTWECYLKPQFILPNPTQDKSASSVLFWLNTVCTWNWWNWYDPAGTWVRHRPRLWTRDYCFFSEAWDQLKSSDFFVLVWFNSWLLLNAGINEDFIILNLCVNHWNMKHWHNLILTWA